MTIDQKLVTVEEYEALKRLAELVGAHFPFKDYQSYARYDTLVQEKKQEYRQKLREERK